MRAPSNHRWSQRIVGAFFLTAATLSGCMPKTIEVAAVSPRPLPGINVLPGKESKSRNRRLPPFSLEIKEEVNDGTTLYVRGVVEFKTQWDAREVALRLTGYANGKPISSATTSLNNRDHTFADPEATSTAKGSFARQFILRVPSVGLSDYQLELLWGSELPEIISDRIELVFEKQRVTPPACESYPCEGEIVVEGILVNTSEKKASNITLLVGFPQLDAGALPQPVELPTLSLEAQARQPLRLRFPRKLLTSISELQCKVQIKSGP